MRRYFWIILLPWLVATASAETQVGRLETEHLPGPLGIDTATPRLSWWITSEKEGFVQSSYRIVVGNDSASVATGQGSMWDTGQVQSPVMLVHYAGRDLQPFTT